MKKPNKKLSRIASRLPIAVQPAGTPTAASAQEAPSPATPDEAPAVGDSVNLPPDVVAWPDKTTGSEAAAENRTETNKLTENERQELSAKAGKLLEADLPRQTEPPAATVPPAKKDAVAPPQRTPGAGWWIPPQQPSQFGVKK